MNRWKIPAWLELEVITRDKHCVFCGVEFSPLTETRRTRPTWEHIVNDEKIIDRDNIARCCMSCNASKGAKLLSDWLTSAYCTSRNINFETVAPVVKRAIDATPVRASP